MTSALAEGIPPALVTVAKSTASSPKFSNQRAATQPATGSAAPGRVVKFSEGPLSP
jgi:hypothetical protein